MRNAKIVILEGTWWSNHEVPLVLPYFQALAALDKTVSLSHRTFRNAEDIKYYVSRIPRNSGVFLYFACHGRELSLLPSDDKSKIGQTDLLQALNTAKEGAIDFIHFGCCEMVDPSRRRACHERILDAAKAKWTSGYTKEVDWLDSMFLELALVRNIFTNQKRSRDGRVTQPKKTATQFYSDYEQLARRLGFSALSRLSKEAMMFPDRLQS